MHIANRIALLLIALPLLAGMQDAVETQEKAREPVAPVYVVPLEGPIDKGLAMYIDRAVSDAESEGAACDSTAR